MKPSEACYALIRRYEGLRLEAYQDPAGVWTIGYGHTGPVDGKPIGPGMRITRERAEALLRETVSRVADGVQAALKRPAQQHEFDAFVSFAYNVGVGAFRSSTLLRKWNAGDTVGAAREFARWIRAGGQILEGLVYRRWDEALVYLGVLK